MTAEETQMAQMQRLFYTCRTCGNRCLEDRDKGRPTVCHPGCSKPDWHVDPVQEPWLVGGKRWRYPEGVVIE